MAFIGVFLWGVDTAFFFVPARTLLQRYAPAAFHGRVLSLNQSLEPTAGIVMTPLVALALGVVGVQSLGCRRRRVRDGRRRGAAAARSRRRLTVPRPTSTRPPALRDAIALGGAAPG